MGFICAFKDLLSRLKAGKSFVKLGEIKGTEILEPQVVKEGQTLLACLSEEGRLLIYGLDEVRQLPGGGKGVTLMDLNIGERLLAAKPISAEGVLVTGIGRGNKPREEVVKKNHLQYHLGHRARKGKALDVRWKVKALEELSAKVTLAPPLPLVTGSARSRFQPVSEAICAISHSGVISSEEVTGYS